MLTRTVRIQVTVFLLIAVLGVSYTGIRYADLGRFVGLDGYRVDVELAESGGIFANAEVTYRGVPVGRVDRLELRPGGVTAVLGMDRGGPDIPASASAVVVNRSAVGEQYVDLRPDATGGPALADGSIIPVGRTSVPLPIEQVVASADGLVRSVPLDDLSTVVEELGLAFSDTGPALRSLVVDGQALTRAAIEAKDPTLQLIRDARTVLQTQNDLAPQVRSFSDDLRLVAEQLRTSDPDLRGLVRTLPQLAGEVRNVLTDTGAPLEGLLADLLTTSRLLEPRTDGLRQLLVTFPVMSAGSFSVVPEDGIGNIQLDLNLAEPPVCTRGYEGTVRRPGSETSDDMPANYDARCAETSPSPIGVRGDGNAPDYGPAPEPTEPGGFRPTGTRLSAGQDEDVPGLAGAPGLPGPPASIAGPLEAQR